MRKTFNKTLSSFESPRSGQEGTNEHVQSEDDEAALLNRNKYAMDRGIPFHPQPRASYRHVTYMQSSEIKPIIEGYRDEEMEAQARKKQFMKTLPTRMLSTA